jgi:hypothetical protein
MNQFGQGMKDEFNRVRLTQIHFPLPAQLHFEYTALQDTLRGLPAPPRPISYLFLLKRVYDDVCVLGG